MAQQLTIKQASIRLGISERSVFRRIKSGAIQQNPQTKKVTLTQSVTPIKPAKKAVKNANTDTQLTRIHTDTDKSDTDTRKISLVHRTKPSKSASKPTDTDTMTDIIPVSQHKAMLTSKDHIIQKQDQHITRLEKQLDKAHEQSREHRVLLGNLQETVKSLNNTILQLSAPKSKPAHHKQSTSSAPKPVISFASTPFGSKSVYHPQTAQSPSRQHTSNPTQARTTASIQRSSTTSNKKLDIAVAFVLAILVVCFGIAGYVLITNGFL